MKIAVCVKQIQNPEIPSAQFRIDEDAKVLIPVSGLSPVLSPFDEQAVEAAPTVESTEQDTKSEESVETSKKSSKSQKSSKKSKK